MEYTYSTDVYADPRKPLLDMYAPFEVLFPAFTRFSSSTANSYMYYTYTGHLIFSQPHFSKSGQP